MRMKTCIKAFRVARLVVNLGKFHDQGDTKWIVINNTPFGRPTPCPPNHGIRLQRSDEAM
jgi:hypothetical protein